MSGSAFDPVGFALQARDALLHCNCCPEGGHDDLIEDVEAFLAWLLENSRRIAVLEAAAVVGPQPEPAEQADDAWPTPEELRGLSPDERKRVLHNYRQKRYRRGARGRSQRLHAASPASTSPSTQASTKTSTASPSPASPASTQPSRARSLSLSDLVGKTDLNNDHRSGEELGDAGRRVDASPVDAASPVVSRETNSALRPDLHVRLEVLLGGATLSGTARYKLRDACNQLQELARELGAADPLLLAADGWARFRSDPDVRRKRLARAEVFLGQLDQWCRPAPVNTDRAGTPEEHALEKSFNDEWLEERTG